MTRYQFLIYHQDLQMFLEGLREVGMMEITTTSWRGNQSEHEMFETSEHYKRVVKEMRSLAAKSPAGVDSPVGVELPIQADEIVRLWDSTSASVVELNSRIESLQHELGELRLWGEFDPSLISSLSSHGLTLHYYKCLTGDFKAQWAEQYPLQIVSQEDKMTYFVVVSSPESPVGVISASVVTAPEMSASAMEQLISTLHREVETCESRLASLAPSVEVVAQAQYSVQEAFELSRATHGGERLADDTIVLLEGWCESANDSQIVAFAESEQVYYQSEKAREEHNPPVKLKNNFFGRLFEPIGALYMMPRYNELDLTFFFAPFFMIFFGMCLGDAGYGMVFILALLIFWKKIPAKFKDFGWLGLFLSSSAVVFGLLTGNCFGIVLFEVEALAPLRNMMLLSDSNTVFDFSVVLGAVQVLFGQILRVFNRIKRGGAFVYGVSSLGWVILFISLIVANFTEQTEALWFNISLIVSGIMILFFANPKANIFVSFGSGLYSVYEMATGVIGDLISYVRLFAVGLSGAIIAQVFNELAFGLSPDIIVLRQVMILLILLAGHGLNIFLSTLGAFVHPVRLTFVEFFRNAEFEGGSRKFAPLRRVKDNE
ncbi:MAG: V-type ATPase 116kDa subunit family protein [Rikenellaceae bacterium]